MASFNIIITWERRLCDVDGKNGYFHIWEQRHDGVYGIVDLADGIRRVEPDKIKFCDEEHSALAEFDKYMEAKKAALSLKK